MEILYIFSVVYYWHILALSLNIRPYLQRSTSNRNSNNIVASPPCFKQYYYALKLICN